VRELFSRALTIGLVIGLLVTGPAAGVERSPAGPAVRGICRLPPRFLLRTWRGYHHRRSGEIQLVARGQNVVGSGFPHAGPQDHLQEVPVFLYGPGLIQPGRQVARPVTSADIIPTEARLLGFDPGNVDGSPLEEALVPGAPPPALIVTLIWDAAGHVVLDEHPKAWPELRSLKPGGTWYEHATVGSSPSTSAAIHATIGTGTYPRRHGLSGNMVRYRGRLIEPGRLGPRVLTEPALADRYDAASGNAPLVAAIGSAAIQLGLIGHGTMWEGGDADLAVLKSPGGFNDSGAFWGLQGSVSPFFDFPEYVNDLPPLAAYHQYADLFDGKDDGAWHGDSMGRLRNGWDSPARMPFETRVIEEVIRREGFGDDTVPDLLAINYKLIDLVSHEWSMHSPQMRDAVRAHDAELPRLVHILDQEVGPGRWVLLLTADHGATPHPRVTGGWPIDTGDVGARIRAAFDDGDGRPLVQQVQPTQVFLDRGELPAGGAAAVAGLIGRLTQADTASVGARPAPGEAGDRVFAAAFPSGLMRRLPCLPEARRG
jgi:Type I phosphodiesterase / nucleotide pyrophosphatase